MDNTVSNDIITLNNKFIIYDNGWIWLNQSWAILLPSLLPG